MDDEIISIPRKRWYQWLCPHWWDDNYELSHPVWQGSARICRICKKGAEILGKTLGKMEKHKSG